MVDFVMIYVCFPYSKDDLHFDEVYKKLNHLSMVENGCIKVEAGDIQRKNLV